ncbi:SMC family ATPase, partial [Caballeronia mineralivorans]|uniref:SMC family ATPase n=1 Tax=Caballeronia mineralivorans TaxID=2010198 RepID=UPI002AFF4F2E
NGTLETFFTSVFSAQNRRPLAAYGAGEIKTLLAELLGIEHLKALSAKAGDVARVLGRALDAIQAEIVSLSRKRERVTEVERLINADFEALRVARTERDAGVTAGNNLTQQRATLAVKQGESAAIEARLRQLGVRRDELTKAAKTLSDDDTATSTRVQQRASALNRTVSTHQATLAQRGAILGAAAQRDDAQLLISREEARIEPLQKEIAVLEAKQVQHAELQGKLRGLETEGPTKAAHYETLSKQAAVVETVPCVGHEMHSTCPLLSQAREAKAHAEVQRISVSELRATYASTRKLAAEIAPMIEQLATKRADLKSLNAVITAARQTLQKATELAANKPLLDAATAGLETAQSELKALAEEEGARRIRVDADKARLSAQLLEIKEEVTRLGAVDVTAAIAEIDRQLRANREALAAFDARIEGLIRSQTTLQAEGDRLAIELGGFSATQLRADRLSDENSRWKLLAKGLGNDGVVALTIDDAGPALTHTVNELLLACYGRRFTVEIRTQRALASGELREGFQILVHDADNDSTKVVEVMSGGQKVWINECLTRGIALYLAQNAGQAYQTLFSDESDGPLDSERKLQFMRMKREVLRQGGYQREFFISQTPDLVAEADAIIDVQALAA